MALYTDQQFNDFFEGYAPNVEGFYEVAYWHLSDVVIQQLVRRHLGVRPGDHIVDAGGGTGRWACWYAQHLDVEVTIADKSEAMLEEAAKIVADAGLSDKVHFVQTDLQDGAGLGDDAFDGLVSTYGVLSFIDDIEATYRTFQRILKPGANGLAMCHSLANALSSKVNRDGAPISELRELAEKQIVRWSDSVPPLRVYSAADLDEAARAAGLAAHGCFGITTIASPGAADFGYPYTSVSDISQRLSDPEWFRYVLELELMAAERPEWAERGTNLMHRFSKVKR